MISHQQLASYTTDLTYFASLGTLSLSLSLSLSVRVCVCVCVWRSKQLFSCKFFHCQLMHDSVYMVVNLINPSVEP